MRTRIAGLQQQLRDAPAALLGAVRGVPLTFAVITPAYVAGWYLQKVPASGAARRGAAPSWVWQQSPETIAWAAAQTLTSALVLTAVAASASWLVVRDADRSPLWPLSWLGRTRPAALAAGATGYLLLLEGSRHLQAYLCAVTPVPPAAFTVAREALAYIFALVAAQLAMSERARHAPGDLAVTLRLSFTTVAAAGILAGLTVHATYKLYGAALTAAWPNMVSRAPEALIEQLYLGAGPGTLQILALSLYFAAARSVLKQ